MSEGRGKAAGEMNRKLLALAVSLCMVTLPSYGANWVYVEQSVNGDVFYIDKSSLQRDGDSVTFWTRINNKERTRLGDLSSRIQETINCRTRESIMRYVMTYDDIYNRGRLTDSFNPMRKWEPIPPETILWEKMLFVCR